MKRIKIKSSPFTISKRKQCFFLKSCLPFIFFLVIIALLSKQNSIQIPASDEQTTDREMKFKAKSNLALEMESEEDLKMWRKSVLKENTDEFLELVLKEVSFIEVDFNQQLKLDSHASYDKEIETQMKNIKPWIGKGGEKATVPPDQENIANEILKKDAFNRILSEMIPVNRSLPDTREVACRNLTYDTSDLPSMSIIVIFTNEAFISIIRMLHSLFNRTPPHLLREVVLVDDFSDYKDLKEKLERYLMKNFPLNKIRLVRLSKRSGLIRARMIGSHVAVGDVLMFLDAHCEVISKWSEPLLHRIKEKRTAVAVPVIDVIDSKTLEYYKGNDGYFFIGGFKWTGHFYWIKVPEYEENTKEHHYEPTKTPTMAGGLFAIDRKYFWEMGSYDPDMQIWGGENLEMSFRIWQCGGSVEIIPCSRVGHIFRPFRPYTFDTSYSRRNTNRVASVWMDEYKSFFLQNASEPDSIGDVSRRLAFRERKECKSFQWYLDTIYKEKFRLHLDSKKWGQVRNLVSDQCLDDMGIYEERTILSVYPCHPTLFQSQTYYLSNNNELRKELLCAWGDAAKTKVEMLSCDNTNNDAFKWDYDHLGRLWNRAAKRCLTVLDRRETMGRYEVVLDRCSNVSRQKWIFDNFKEY